MFKSLFAAITELFKALGNVAKLLGITSSIAIDLAQAGKHISTAYEVKVQMFEQQRIDLLSQYKDEIITHAECITKIKELNSLIKQLEEETSAE